MIRTLFFALPFLFLAQGCGTGSPSGGDDTGGSPQPQTPPVANPLLRVSALNGTLGNAGSAGPADEFPAHSVVLSAVEMQTYETTWHELCGLLSWKCSLMVGGRSDTLARSASGDTLLGWGRALLLLDSQYVSVDLDTAADSSLYMKFTPVDSRRNYPVINVSFFGAAFFCNLKSEKESLARCYDSLFGLHPDSNGYRLPTEAEWEMAARGGRTGDSAYFPTGATLSRFLANYQWDVGGIHLKPVGLFPGNPDGIYDLAGNVWEWCADVYDSTFYATLSGTATDPIHSPAAPSDTLSRVLRGGSFQDGAPELRTANRAFSGPGTLHGTLGFRMARRI